MECKRKVFGLHLYFPTVCLLYWTLPVSVMLVICAHVYTLHTHTHHIHTLIFLLISRRLVRLHNEHQMDLYLMEYMKNGGPLKKKGVRGDSDKPFDYHSEL